MWLLILQEGFQLQPHEGFQLQPQLLKGLIKLMVKLTNVAFRAKAFVK